MSARRKRLRLEDPPPPGAPRWIVTFSDMVSLLVTFFVMLMSFSTTETREVMLVLQAFTATRSGILEDENGRSAVEPPQHDRMRAVNPTRGALRPHVRDEDKLVENLAEMGQKDDPRYVPIDLTRAPDGLLVGFGPEAAFAPGSAEVGPELRRSLVDIARVLEHYQHLIVVEGFTDAAFAPTPRYPTAQALAAARAAAAAEVMLEESALPPQRLQISGVGARPRTNQASASGRTASRRVELRILSLSRARAERLHAQEER